VRGLLAGLLLAGLDLFFFRQALSEQFPSRLLQLRLAGHLASLSMLALLPLGLAVGWLVVLSNWLSQTQRGRLAGLLWATVAAPMIGWVAFSLFLGGKMQRVPMQPLWSTLLLGIGLLLVAKLAPRLLFHWQRLQQGPLSARLLSGVAVAGLLLLFHIADRTILPRLYPWFHGSLLVLQLLTAGLVASLPIPIPPKSVLVNGLLFFVCGLAVWQGTRSLDKLRRAMAMRGVVYEKTQLAGRILSVIPKRRGVTPRTTAISDNPERAPAYSGPRLSGRDVFLITIDAFRHDRLTPEVTPTIYSLAQRGIQFSRAYTQVPHTSFAVATLLTGKPVYALMQLGHDAGSHKTLPLLLRNYHFKTAAFYPPSVFFVEHERLQALEDSAYGFEYVKCEYLPGEKRTQQLIDFLEQEHPEQVFAWIHYLEPHEPYEVHPGGPAASRPDRERYDGEIHFIDQQIARLTEYLSRTRPGALLLFAADHGEEFGEHGGRYHGTSLYDEQARVPLVLFDSATTSVLTPHSYPQAVGLIDVAPTLLGLLDIEPPLQMRGQNLAPWLLTHQESLPQRAIWSEIGKKKMIVYGDHKLICDLADDSCQVFDLLHDPQERKNLVDSDPRRALELRGRLQALLQESHQYEQAAQGRPPQLGDVSDAAQASLASARLGDRSALPSLLKLIGNARSDENMQRDAVRLAALLSTQAVSVRVSDADPLATIDRVTVRTAKESVSQRFLAQGTLEQRRWAAALLTRLGDDTPDSAALLQELLGDETAPPSQRLAAALAQWSLPACRSRRKQVCVADSLRVLDAAMSIDDPDQVRPLLRLLSESHDGRALAPLLRQLTVVRSRVDVVEALGQLGDRRAIPSLGETLLADPYVHVRSAAVLSLRKLGGPEAQAILQRAHKSEREPAVQAVLSSASPSAESPLPTRSGASK